MFMRYLAPAATAFALLACSAASAAPTTVQLRVEGSTRTVFEGPVTTDGKTIAKGADTVVCDGTLNPANAPGPTATSALDDGALQSGVTWDATFYAPDFFLTRFGDQVSEAWGLAVNYLGAQVGGCQLPVHAGDEVLWAADFFGGPPDYAQKAMLRLDGPAKAVVGAPTTVVVTDGTTHAPVAGATVGGALTGPDGTAAVTLGSAGVAQLKAEAPASIRSNALAVCVSQTGAEDCGLPALAGSPVKDSVAPRARIGGPRDGRHFRRGPRLLNGTASDDVGVTKVKLSLRRHEHRKPCRWWSGTSERFAGRGCSAKVFFGIDAGSKWSYLLPRRLAPGRYVLDVKAFDRARNRDERFVRGSNRVVFYVGRSYRDRVGAARVSKAARVRVLLAGRSKTVASVVRARATVLKVGRRACRVGASTPLAALAAVARGQHTGYRIRDYGSCSRKNEAASGQLFVRRVGEDANRGNDGWFYKVNDRAPEIGAGDPAARLRAGDRLLWFYCVFDEGARSCQRSLRIVPAGGSASGGLNVSVRGYDNAGHSMPVTGATVATGPVKVVSGANGVAALAASGGPGRYRVTATKDGMIGAFPLTVTVK